VTETTPSSPVTTTDALKAAALLIILIDHIGHFLLPDLPLLRVIGRLGPPIFFFLIGFARTREVPLRWLWLGAILTGVDFLWTGRLNQTMLAVLFNFAAIRLALPLIEKHALAPPLRLVALVLALILLVRPTSVIIEYSIAGWLFALAGLFHRRCLDEGVMWKQQRDFVSIISVLVYIVTEQIDYNFPFVLTGLLALEMLLLIGVLQQFQRKALDQQPVPPVASVMRFCGRYSLEIYAAQIIGLAAIGGLWNLLK
jgi:TraX protein